WRHRRGDREGRARGRPAGARRALTRPAGARPLTLFQLDARRLGLALELREVVAPRGVFLEGVEGDRDPALHELLGLRAAELLARAHLGQRGARGVYVLGLLGKRTLRQLAKRLGHVLVVVEV